MLNNFAGALPLNSPPRGFAFIVVHLMFFRLAAYLSCARSLCCSADVCVYVLSFVNFFCRDTVFCWTENLPFFQFYMSEMLLR